jgi:hypothetical protein
LTAKEGKKERRFDEEGERKTSRRSWLKRSFVSAMIVFEERRRRQPLPPPRACVQSENERDLMMGRETQEWKEA